MFCMIGIFRSCANFLLNRLLLLPAGGLIVIHDAHINAEKTGPLPVAPIRRF
jgi:hypothetical protein